MLTTETSFRCRPCSTMGVLVEMLGGASMGRGPSVGKSGAGADCFEAQLPSPAMMRNIARGPDCLDATRLRRRPERAPCRRLAGSETVRLTSPGKHPADCAQQVRLASPASKCEASGHPWVAPNAPIAATMHASRIHVTGHRDTKANACCAAACSTVSARLKVHPVARSILWILIANLAIISLTSTTESDSRRLSISGC